MSNNKIHHNLKDTISTSLDWPVIQKEMKNKLGNDIYTSWLSKIDFVEEMKKLCVDNIDQLRFVVYTRTPERFLAASNALCLPSYREGFGSVVIEAAAMGLPAIASDIYGISDAIVDNGTGLLHQPGDAECIKRCMDLFLARPDKLERLGCEARSRAVKNFDAERITEYWLGFYDKVLKSFI